VEGDNFSRRKNQKEVLGVALHNMNEGRIKVVEVVVRIK